MPQRTNDFQTLIALISQQLAPTGAQVVESQIVKDMVTGGDVEIDTVITHHVAGADVTIAIESRDRRRLATVEWIRELKGKYATLPIDMVIAVSKRGFTKEALRLANQSRIRTFSLEAASNVDWATVVTRIQKIEIVANLVPVPSSIAVTCEYEDGTEPPDLDNLDPQHLGLFDPSGQFVGTLFEITKRIAESEGMRAIARENLDYEGSCEIELEFEPAKGTYLIDGLGNHIVVQKCRARVRAMTISKNLQFEQSHYADAVIAHGAEDFGGGRLVFAVIEKPHQPLTVTASVRSNSRKSSTNTNSRTSRSKRTGRRQ